MITVANSETGVSNKLRTSLEGRYALPFLVPGDYTISVEKPGFKRSAQGGVRVEAKGARSVDVELTPEEKGALLPASWVSDLFSFFRSWQFIVLLLLVYLALSRGAPQRTRELLRPFRTLKLFGAEVELSEEAAKQVAKNADEAIEAYRKQVKWEYDRGIEVHGLAQKLEDVLERYLTPVLGRLGAISGFRCTIHVPDILFDETLYQLLDYYPVGGGRGRTWSLRFGIIGRTWRLGDAEIKGDVPTNSRDLILEWGMTRKEAAAAGQGKRSFACVVLRSEEDTNVGIFYMDATGPDAFGATTEAQDRLKMAICRGCKDTGLTNALVKLGEELRSRGPLINIYGL